MWLQILKTTINKGKPLKLNAHPMKSMKFSIAVLLLIISEMHLEAQCPNAPTADCPTCPNCPLDFENCEATPTFTPKVNVIISGFWRIVSSNGIPDHPIGIFPLEFPPKIGLSDAERKHRKILEVCCGRPNAITEQMHVFAMPAYPGTRKPISSPSDVQTFWLPVPAEAIPTILRPDIPAPFGVAVNGIPFDPAAAEWWNGSHDWSMNPLEHPEMETDLDCNNGHVQPNGAYHYHGFPEALYEGRGGEWPLTGSRMQKIVQLGWAFDGAEIYGPICYQKPATSVNGQNWIEVETAWETKSGSRGAGAPPGDYSSGYYVQDYEASRLEYRSHPLKGPVLLDQCNGHVNSDFLDGAYHYHITTDFPYIPRCYAKILEYGGPGDID